jgi:hypothetical protein
MKDRIFPMVAIIIVAIILILINEYTELTFIKDYALIFIIAGMFFGLWLSNLSNKKKKK